MILDKRYIEQISHAVYVVKGRHALCVACWTIIGKKSQKYETMTEIEAKNLIDALFRYCGAK